MDKKLKKLYDEGYEKSMRGETFRLLTSGGEKTTRTLEKALEKDSEIWKECFFYQWVSEENKERFKNDKVLRDFSEALYKSAFMFGGCFYSYVINFIMDEMSKRQQTDTTLN